MSRSRVGYRNIDRPSKKRMLNWDQLKKQERQNRDLSIRTIRTKRLFSRRALTDQELEIKWELLDAGIPFQDQVILKTPNWVYVVDFLLKGNSLPGVPLPVVIESSYTNLTDGRGLSVLRMKAQSLDTKFRHIQLNLGFLCVALLECAACNDIDDLRDQLTNAFTFADLVLCDTRTFVQDLQLLLPPIIKEKRE